MSAALLQQRIGVTTVEHRRDDRAKAAELCKPAELYQRIHRTRDYVRLYRDLSGKATITDLYKNIRRAVVHEPEVRYASTVVYEADKRLDRSKHLPGVTQTPTDQPGFPAS